MGKEDTSYHLKAVILATVYGGLAIARILSTRTELWMGTIIISGSLLLWWAHLMGGIGERAMELLIVAYFGVVYIYSAMHGMGTAWLSLSLALPIGALSLLGNVRWLDLIFSEYLLLFFVNMVFRLRGREPRDGSVDLIFGLVSAFFMYKLSRDRVTERLRIKAEAEEEESRRRREDPGVEAFLAGLSHEVRTPINVVTGLSLLSMKDGGDERAFHIHGAGMRLADELEALQDLAEIAGDRVRVMKERYSLNALLQWVLRRAKDFGSAEGLRTVVVIDDLIPRNLTGDEDKMRKVLWHLVALSLGATRTGGVCVRLICSRQPYGANPGMNLDIEVQDTALSEYPRDNLRMRVLTGLSHAMGGFVRVEHLPGEGNLIRASIPHAQTQQQTSSDAALIAKSAGKTRGVLYINQAKISSVRVREFYRGALDDMARTLSSYVKVAESEEELKYLWNTRLVTHIFTERDEFMSDEAWFMKARETAQVFVFTGVDDVALPSGITALPMPFCSIGIRQALSGEVIDVAHRDGKALFKGVRALVVDDEEMNLAVAVGLLGSYRMRVETALSGEEAVEKCLVRDYDVVFVDHMMPGMNGVETLQRLRTMGEEMGKERAYVAFTANASSAAREELMDAGFDGFLSKPLDMEELERTMTKLGLRERGAKR